jgi:hypothetical protein
MPLMTIFEPLFLLLALVTLASLVTAAVFGLRGEFARAARTLRRLGVGAAVYIALVIVVSIFNPRQVYRVGEPQCFDDWCITVVEAGRVGRPPDTAYEVSLQLSNRARGAPMGEKGTVVYLTDANGRRYDPLADPSAARFDAILQPGQSSVARRRFVVPRDVQGLGMVYTHEGGFPIGWFIVGEGGWFQKPPIVRLD